MFWNQSKNISPKVKYQVNSFKRRKKQVKILQHPKFLLPSHRDDCGCQAAATDGDGDGSDDADAEGDDDEYENQYPELYPDLCSAGAGSDSGQWGGGSGNDEEDDVGGCGDEWPEEVGLPHLRNLFPVWALTK